MEQRERRVDHITEQDVHNKHHQYIATIIAREQQKIKLRQAIIEKTIAALIWSAIVGFGTICWTYLKEHLR